MRIPFLAALAAITLGTGGVAVAPASAQTRVVIGVGSPYHGYGYGPRWRHRGYGVPRYGYRGYYGPRRGYGYGHPRFHGCPRYDRWHGYRGGRRW